MDFEIGGKLADDKEVVIDASTTIPETNTIPFRNIFLSIPKSVENVDETPFVQRCANTTSSYVLPASQFFNPANKSLYFEYSDIRGMIVARDRLGVTLDKSLSYVRIPKESVPDSNYSAGFRRYIRVVEFVVTAPLGSATQTFSPAYTGSAVNNTYASQKSKPAADMFFVGVTAFADASKTNDGQSGVGDSAETAMKTNLNAMNIKPWYASCFSRNWFGRHTPASTQGVVSGVIDAGVEYVLNELNTYTPLELVTLLGNGTSRSFSSSKRYGQIGQEESIFNRTGKPTMIGARITQINTVGQACQPYKYRTTNAANTTTIQSLTVSKVQYSILESHREILIPISADSSVVSFDIGKIVTRTPKNTAASYPDNASNGYNLKPDANMAIRDRPKVMVRRNSESEFEHNSIRNLQEGQVDTSLVSALLASEKGVANDVLNYKYLVDETSLLYSIQNACKFALSVYVEFEVITIKL